jgi:hypothetical protein
MPSAPSNSPSAVPPTQSAKKQPEPAEEGSRTCPPHARADPNSLRGTAFSLDRSKAAGPGSIPTSHPSHPPTPRSSQQPPSRLDRHRHHRGPGPHQPPHRHHCPRVPDPADHQTAPVVTRRHIPPIILFQCWLCVACGLFRRHRNDLFSGRESVVRLPRVAKNEKLARGLNCAIDQCLCEGRLEIVRTSLHFLAERLPIGCQKRLICLH